jgi:hypothetical protein
MSIMQTKHSRTIILTFFTANNIKAKEGSLKISKYETELQLVQKSKRQNYKKGECKRFAAMIKEW